jgi:ferrochelatase
MRCQPAIRSVPPYYDHPAYIQALGRTIKTHREGLTWAPDVNLASFHGLPESFIEKGDPYQRHCQETVGLLRAELGLGEKELLLTYQSRTGRAIWIGPDTEESLASLARSGTKNLMVVAPGFAADCVETLEEIQLRAAEVFRDNGGHNFSLVPCLNDGPESISMLVEIISQQISGWGE